MNRHELQQIDRRKFLGIGVGVAGVLWVAPAPRLSASEALDKLIVHSSSPPNAEPPLDRLIASWITPVENFYVRSHAPTPNLRADDFTLVVEGMVTRPLRLTLDELRDQFPKETVEATMTCAGNRREEHSRVKTISGVQWKAGAIGNARWGGVRLSTLLAKAGVRDSARHVWFEEVEAVSKQARVTPFGASIPLDKAQGDSTSMPGTLVTYEMNGEPLTPDHGFPLRTVVPGYIGARSVKWLGKIVVSDRPSPNHYVAEAYKLVTEGTDQEWQAADPIGAFPINSVTCQPAAGAKLAAGPVTISGYALAPGVAGRTVQKVEVSTDEGKSWTSARFTTPAKPFCWRLWTAELRLTDDVQGIVVRATDSAGHTQPASVPWNLKGYLYNAWHRTPVKVQS